MRTVMLFLVAALAGCATSEPQAEIPQDVATEAPQWNNETYPFAGMTEYCLNNETCDFWDHQFHQGSVYHMDTLELDAIVLPVPGADSLVATEAAGLATARWQNVTDLAAPWFAESFQLRTYVMGQDILTPEALSDPEIIVVSESAQRSTSIGLNAEQLACSIVGQDGQLAPGGPAAKTYPVHSHDGMAIIAAECVTGGFRCLALNFAGALGGSNPLYDLVAHEVGHCLGTSHVGDALDFNARYVPEADIMSYADNPSRVSCVSTLNARTMEGIYAHLADQPVPQWFEEDHYYAMDPWDYAQVDCKNPPEGIL